MGRAAERRFVRARGAREKRSGVALGMGGDEVDAVAGAEQGRAASPPCVPPPVTWPVRHLCENGSRPPLNRIYGLMMGSVDAWSEGGSITAS